MSNQSIEQLIQIITALLTSQPEKKGRISLEDAITALNSTEFKAQVEKALGKGEAKPKSEPKLKDENAPKRPKSAYMFFSEKKRPEIKEENPDLKMTEVAKVLGERWKEASPESKAKYAKKADKDKIRYNEEMKSYVRPSDEVLMEQKSNQKRRKSSGEEKEKKPRAKKSEGAPKGAKSAYIFFCAAKRDEVKEAFPDFKATEVTKELARMWKEDYCTDVDREEYVKQAVEDKERYVQEKAEWEEKSSKPEKVSTPEKSSEKSSESEEERVIKSDDYYIGKIPANCTYEQLVKIMAKAVIKVRKEHHEGEDVKYEDVLHIMDLWFEHDENMEKTFSHLVKDERYDEFEQDVLAVIFKREGSAASPKPSPSPKPSQSPKPVSPKPVHSPKPVSPKPVSPKPAEAAKPASQVAKRSKSATELKKVAPMTFNQTGQEVSKMRACLKRYLKSKPSGEKKNYRMKYFDGDQYFGIDYGQLVITATSRLEAIFKLKDYFNEHAKCPKPFDAFVDDSFNDIVSEYDDIEEVEEGDGVADPESVFKSKHIDKIISKFVEGEFNNDSLWLEECDEVEESDE